MTAVEDSTCAERMEAQSKLITTMFDQIKADISEMKADLKELKSTTAKFVPWEVFNRKCDEIDELKKFVWKVSGGIGVVSFLLGIAVRFLK